MDGGRPGPFFFSLEARKSGKIKINLDFSGGTWDSSITFDGNLLEFYFQKDQVGDHGSAILAGLI